MSVDALPRESDPEAVPPPWILRGPDWVTRRPFRAGTVAAIMLVGIQVSSWMLLQRAMGEEPGLVERQLRAILFFSVVIGFSPVAFAQWLRAVRRELQDLGPLLEIPRAELREGQARAESVPLPLSLGVAAAFQLLAFASMEANVGRISTLLSPDRTTFDVYVLGMSFLVIATITVPLLLLLRVSLFVRSVGLHHVRVPLLELDRLAPFGRIGVRAAVVVPAVLGFAMMVGTDIRIGAVIGASLFAAAVSLVGLLVPSLGIRRRVSEAKQDELARISSALRGEPGALAGSPLAPEADAMRTVDLLHYRSFVSEQRDWPIAYEQWRRFGAFLLIPLLTWAGKALVGAALERLLA
ncbi:MAG: hypothetical protein QNK05_01355 [Myxococcota bacterium]|nr:hypothetical protein [Myxococcota bacterium]